MREATCESCGEMFLPNDERDAITRNGVTLYEHYERDDGATCGGYGPITGEWSTRTTVELDDCTCPRGSFDPGCAVHGDADTLEDTTTTTTTTILGYVGSTLLADLRDPMMDIVNVNIDRGSGSRGFAFYAPVGAYVSGDDVTITISKVNR